MFFRLGTGEVLRHAFQVAGFSAITVQRLETWLHYDNAEEACGAAFIGGPVALACSRFSEQTMAEAQAEYLASLAPYRQGEGYDVPGEFVVVAGIK